MKRIVTGMALLLAATGLAQAAGDAAAGQMVFVKCMICHKVGPGAMNGVGPVLNGIVGRMAGTVAGYMYSDDGGATFVDGGKGRRLDSFSIVVGRYRRSGRLLSGGVTIK